jgi:Flp pilus assembly protein TadG
MSRSWSRTGTPAKRTQRGSVMLEFALSSLLLISVFTGTFQFGYTFYVYNKLETAVIGATRYASINGITNNNNQDVPTSFSTRVKNMAVYGTPTPATGATPVAPGLTTGNISVGVTFADAGTASNRPTDVTVEVTNYQVDAVFKTFTFSGKPALRMSYTGSYCSEVATCP